MSTLLTPAELEARLRDIGATRYHNLHPFHRRLHAGQCTKGEVQAWALNRYCYQAAIPIKDASLIARCEDADVRREWRRRLADHDGTLADGADAPGGIERWLRLTDGVGLDRGGGDLAVLRPAGHPLRRAGLYPVRARAQPAGSHRLVADRAVLAADHQRARLRHARALRLRDQGHAGLFRQAPAAGQAGQRLRPGLLPRTRPARPEQQHAVLEALHFKCDVLWTMLDALDHAYGEAGHIPPRAFRPGSFPALTP